MADIIDSCCVNLQMIKADKNNNTTANIDDEIISPFEQSNVLQNGNNDKSEITGDNDEHRLSSNSDINNTITNIASSSNDETEASTNNDLSPNPYKDFSGIDTESFITTTLRNNPKDRTLLLTLEKVFQEFIQNEEQTSHQFQAMNSYERMIVHRVAAFFGLDHNVDKNGQSIIVTKTSNTRIPNFSFQNFIPIDELSNGAMTNLNPPIENTTRRITHRNNKNHSNQQTFIIAKPSFERANHYTETRDKIPNKINRKQQQQRFNTNHHVQQTNIQPSNHFINTRTQPIYPSASNSYYPQQQQSIDHDFKQQTTSSPMYNYVPMMSPTSYQHGNGIPLPILLQQQPNGQIQYVFPTHSLQQPPQLSSDGQYMPVYRSDVMPHVVDNNPYSQSPYVHLYPTHPYPHAQQTTYIQSAPSFMIPPNNPTSIQYATNQLASLNLQSQYDESRFLQSKSFVQTSSNGLNQYRQIRPLNTNHTDKQIPPIENDIKSTDQISLSGSVQDKD